MPGTAHRDRFVLDNLPAPEAWPEIVNLDTLGYPEMLNATVELVDRHVVEGRGERVALRAPGGVAWTYAELSRRIDQYSNVLVSDLGLVPGNRVLLRSANNPVKVALYLAVIKAGGIVVATMPLLRAGELAKAVEKAQIRLALCDASLMDEMQKTADRAPMLERVVSWSGTDGGELGELAAKAPEPTIPASSASPRARRACPRRRSISTVIS